MPPFAVVAERLNPSEAHKTDSIHRLVPSGSRTPFNCFRCTSGKSLFTSMRAAWPALMARDSPLSTGPFCCGVYGAVSSRRIWRPLQYSTNAELLMRRAVGRCSCVLGIIEERGGGANPNMQSRAYDGSMRWRRRNTASCGVRVSRTAALTLNPPPRRRMTRMHSPAVTPTSGGIFLSNNNHQLEDTPQVSCT